MLAGGFADCSMLGQKLPANVQCWAQSGRRFGFIIEQDEVDEDQKQVQRVVL